MNNLIPKSKAIFILLAAFLFASCSMSDRPKMAYDQKDKGAVQDIESFNLMTSAENFRTSAEKFSKETNEIINKNRKEEKLIRRISLTGTEEQQKNL